MILTFVYRNLAAKFFTDAQENSIYHKLYKSKMTDESFSEKSIEVAIKEFLKKEKSVFFSGTGHIPKDTICKVFQRSWFVNFILFIWSSYVYF